MRQVVLMLFVSLLIPLLSTAGQGRGNGDGNRNGKNAAGNQKAKAPDNRAFDTDEKRMIREWFSNGTNLKGLPPGLAKREQLPPGLQKQLARNGKLPPGLEKKVHPLPTQLEIRLPRLPDGWRRIVVGGNVILLEQRTGAILDILANIF